MIAQSRDLSDRKTIENFAAVVQSVERLKLLTILTVADIRAVGPGVWNGWKAQLLRTLYYETEPVLTGGFSEVNRAQRVAAGAGRISRRARRLAGGGARRLYRPALPGLLAQGRSAARSSRMRASCARPSRRARRSRPRRVRRRARRHRAHRAGARPSVAALDHRRRLRGGRRQHRRRADLHHHRRAARSTPSRCRASSTATRTRRAAPRASPTRSRRRCAATLAAGGGGQAARRKGAPQGLRASRPR